MCEGEEKNSLFFFALFFCLGFRVFGQTSAKKISLVALSVLSSFVS